MHTKYMGDWEPRLPFGDGKPAKLRSKL